jgi:hypothetical protein
MKCDILSQWEFTCWVLGRQNVPETEGIIRIVPPKYMIIIILSLGKQKVNLRSKAVSPFQAENRHSLIMCTRERKSVNKFYVSINNAQKKSFLKDDAFRLDHSLLKEKYFDFKILSLFLVR